MGELGWQGWKGNGPQGARASPDGSRKCQSPAKQNCLISLLKTGWWLEPKGRKGSERLVGNSGQILRFMLCVSCLRRLLRERDAITTRLLQLRKRFFPLFGFAKRLMSLAGSHLASKGGSWGGGGEAP